MKKIVLSLVTIATLSMNLCAGNIADDRREFSSLASFLKKPINQSDFTDEEVTNLLPKMRAKRISILNAENEKKILEYKTKRESVSGTQFYKNLESIDNFILNPSEELQKTRDINLEKIEITFKEAQHYDYKEIVNSNKVLYGEPKNIGKFFEKDIMRLKVVGLRKPFVSEQAFIDRIYQLSPTSGSITFSLNNTKNVKTGQDLTVTLSTNSQVLLKIYENIGRNSLATFAFSKLLELELPTTKVPDFEQIDSYTTSELQSYADRYRRKYPEFLRDKDNRDTLIKSIYRDSMDDKQQTEQIRAFIPALKQRLDSLSVAKNGEKILFYRFLNDDEKAQTQAIYDYFGEEEIKRAFSLIAKKKLISISTPLFGDFEFDAGDKYKPSIRILKEDFENKAGDKKIKALMDDAISKKGKDEMYLIKSIFGDEKYFKLLGELIDSKLADKYKYEKDKKESEKVLNDIFR